MKPIFEDLVVVELAGVLAGPAVGQFFAELGAQVLKVEPPGGDVTRSWRSANEPAEATVSAYYSSVNWGKQNVVLDLNTAADRAHLLGLLHNADVLISNQKRSMLERFGLDYITLRERFPRLVVGQIVGYDGTDRLGYDAVVQAESGFMALNGPPDGPPTKLPVALMDLLAAHQLKEGLLVALLNRERTGQGDLVTVSLYGAAVASLANQAATYLWAGEVPQRIGSDHPQIAPYGTVFYDSDGNPLILAVGNDRQFQDVCTVLGLDSLPHDPRFATNPERVRHRAEMHEHLRLAIGHTNRDTLLAQLERVEVPAGAVCNIDEMATRPETEPFILHKDNGQPSGLHTVAFRSQNFGVSRHVSEPPSLPTS